MEIEVNELEPIGQGQVTGGLRPLMFDPAAPEGGTDRVKVTTLEALAGWIADLLETDPSQPDPGLEIGEGMAARAANNAAIQQALDNGEVVRLPDVGTFWMDAYATVFGGTNKLLHLGRNTIMADSRVTNDFVTVSNDNGDLLLSFSANHGLSNNARVYVAAWQGANPWGGTHPGNTAPNVAYFFQPVGVTTGKLKTTAAGPPIAYSHAGSGNIEIFRPIRSVMLLDSGHVVGSNVTIPQTRAGGVGRWKGNAVYDIIAIEHITENVAGVDAPLMECTIQGTTAASVLERGDLLKLVSENPLKTGTTQGTGRSTVAEINTSTNVITTAANHGYTTGDIVWPFLINAADMPVSSPQLVKFEPVFVHVKSSNSYTLHTTLEDAQSDNNPIQITSGVGGGGGSPDETLTIDGDDLEVDGNPIATDGGEGEGGGGPLFFHKGGYRGGDFSHIQGVRIEDGNTIVKCNRTSHPMTVNPRLMAYKDHRLSILGDARIRYRKHQQIASALTNFPDRHHGDNQPAIKILGVKEVYIEKLQSEYGPGSTVAVYGCGWVTARNVSSKLGANQAGTSYPEGDFTGGVFPQNNGASAVDYTLTFTACYSVFFDNLRGETVRHAPSSNPAWQFAGRDGTLAGRNHIVRGTVAGGGQTKDSLADSHATDGMWDMTVYAHKCGGNALNMRSSGRIRLFAEECVRLGQITQQSADDVIDLHVKVFSKNCGPLMVNAFADVTVTGVMDGQFPGQANPHMIVCQNGGNAEIRGVKFLTRNIPGAVVFCQNGGFVRADEQTKFMAKEPITPNSVFAFDIRAAGQGNRAELLGPRVLGANIRAYRSTGGGVAATSAGLIHVPHGGAQEAFGRLLVLPMDEHGMVTSYKPDTLLSRMEHLSGTLLEAEDGEITLVMKAPYGMVIEETVTQCETGTCTATFRIGGTPLGGSANAVSTSVNTQEHALANTLAAGGTLVLAISANAACEKLSFTIRARRLPG